MSVPPSASTDPTFVDLAHQSLPYSRPPTPTNNLLRIGWLGLGAMGLPMLKNLASHPHSHPPNAPPILIYNRTKSRSETLQAELGSKVRIADTPGQLALECDLIYTSLGTDEAVREVYFEFHAALKNSNHSVPKIFVETSTVFPSLASELDALMSQIPHTHYIAAPVFGPPAAAAKRQLVLVCSGDYRSKKVVAYLSTPAFARKVIDLGGNIEKAPIFKLVGNSMILGAIELMGEAMTLAEKSGCGSDKFLEFLKDFFPGGPFINYGTKMIHDEFDGTKGFAIEGGLKDSTHIRRLTTAFNSPMPVVDIAHQSLLTARSIHEKQLLEGTAKHQVLDWSALIAGSRVAAGLPGLDSSTVHSRVIKDE